MSRLEEQESSENFPSTLEGLGYAFNEEGKLRKLNPETAELTEEGFQYTVKEGDKKFNQKHYEALGAVVNEEVFYLLEKECGLNKVWLGDENDVCSFVFVSPDLNTNTEKLLILINGAGAVRAGQWSRKVIINVGLKEGSMIEYIKRFKSTGYSILVLNTNDNASKGKRIPGSETPYIHAQTAWKKLVAPSPAKFICLVAHSAGGVVAVDLGKKFKQDFLDRVGAFLLTDSVHSSLTGDDEVDTKLKAVGKNYVTSTTPLDTKLESKFILIKPSKKAIERVSSGSNEHVMTSHCAIESVVRSAQELFESSQVDGSSA
mmetsp:Transcript_9807/g.11783  ORF Transcript_9807/g.11783 Transcript_9807/m.11783 type:complete len:317 (-) Transcript_9807:75-1025(-)